MGWSLHLKVEPSFEDGFAVYLQEINTKSGLEYRAWAQRGNWMELLPCDELIKKPRSKVDPARAISIAKNFEGKAAPVWPTYVLGLDGVTSTLILSRGMNQITYRWWGDVPQEWAFLGEPISQLHELAMELSNG